VQTFNNFFFKYRFEENLSNIQKYNILKGKCDKMKSENIEIRPNCDQILSAKKEWGLSRFDTRFINRFDYEIICENIV
jgi:hypothetical protein